MCLPIRHLATEDRDGDGRPDVWRLYDARGRLVEIDIDTNRDGRPDVEEFYHDGVLFRRSSDRNFNGQVDLVEDFDAETHQHVRSVVDVDYDGRADLLVLFRDGRPVFSKQAAPLTNAAVASSTDLDQPADYLAPLTDPFRTDVIVRDALVGSPSDLWIGPTTSGALPTPPMVASAPLASVARPATDTVPPVARAVAPRESRGPPPSIL
jgi:hypothetical protein